LWGEEEEGKKEANRSTSYHHPAALRKASRTGRRERGQLVSFPLLPPRRHGGRKRKKKKKGFSRGAESPFPLASRGKRNQSGRLSGTRGRSPSLSKVERVSKGEKGGREKEKKEHRREGEGPHIHSLFARLFREKKKKRGGRGEKKKGEQGIRHIFPNRGWGGGKVTRGGTRELSSSLLPRVERKKYSQKKQQRGGFPSLSLLSL